ncbi:MAG TPA: glutamine--fructose-6-phosphate transaminase (isomerizing), partial [Sulfurimonas sp.]|nr:glutamine--fructose-6-phosphate transaminase (isomerizing) [Sulfurimonas sp.]
MCGIVGYVGKKNSKEILLSGLKELEYRGYDSAGIAVLQDGNFNSFKAIGKLVNLEEKTKDFITDKFSIGIGHTRWATHGKPTELNAHPHIGDESYVVHNGIIENYVELKKELIADGVTFLSQTDTEVIVHLFEKNLKSADSAFDAFKKTISQLQGAYATLLVTKGEEETIFFAKHGSPMLVGINKENEKYFASSDTPLIGQCSDVNYFEDGDYGYVTPSELAIFDKDDVKKEPIFTKLSTNKLSAQKDGFRFFMEKEIYEQSSVISDTLLGRLSDDAVLFDELEGSFFDDINEIKLCACGTSYHSALTATYLFERYAKIKTSIEVASEFRYREPIMSKDTLFVVISQSGETADTLETLKMAKAAGLKTLVICNVDNSSMVRLADACILTRAGVEKGVASTKAFATQVTVFWMMALYLAKRNNSLTSQEIASQIQLLREVPSSVKVNDDMHERIKRLSKRYLHGHGFFFIGRDVFYPLA